MTKTMPKKRRKIKRRLPPGVKLKNLSGQTLKFIQREGGAFSNRARIILEKRDKTDSTYEKYFLNKNIAKRLSLWFSKGEKKAHYGNNPFTIVEDDIPF